MKYKKNPRNISRQICEKYTFLEKKYKKEFQKTQIVDLVDMSPDFDFIIERLEASLHTSSPPAQVNHRQYHCFHHQAEAYAIYDTFGVTWWTNFQLMEVKPTVSQISNNCKWCHPVAKFRTNTSGQIQN